MITYNYLNVQCNLEYKSSLKGINSIKSYIPSEDTVFFKKKTVEMNL